MGSSIDNLVVGVLFASAVAFYAHYRTTSRCIGDACGLHKTTWFTDQPLQSREKTNNMQMNYLALSKRIVFGMRLNLSPVQNYKPRNVMPLIGEVSETGWRSTFLVPKCSCNKDPSRYFNIWREVSIASGHPLLDVVRESFASHKVCFSPDTSRELQEANSRQRPCLCLSLHKPWQHYSTAKCMHQKPAKITSWGNICRWYSQSSHLPNASGRY